MTVVTKATAVPKATSTREEEEETLGNTLANFSIPVDDFVLVTKSDLESPSVEKVVPPTAHLNHPEPGKHAHPPKSNPNDRQNEATVVTIPSMWTGVPQEPRVNLPCGEQLKSAKGGAVTKPLTLATYVAMNNPEPASTAILGLDDPTDYSFCSLKTPVNNITFDGMVYYTPHPEHQDTKAAASGGSPRHTAVSTSSASLLKGGGEGGAFSSYPLHTLIPITAESMRPSSPSDQKTIPYFVSSSATTGTSVDVTVSDPIVNSDGSFYRNLQSEFVIY
ncbi:hypothetical protein IWQ62_005467 [Dispira parvispora]|uniref:Uncharacterized protein n=1 Tax=Dispira parvispora TaxID=1520584 RepID=A0A9W8AIR5_9FUNG|nr:hypothetical protein IWQ62_005467 [Dispira parvispora]